jgi:hypothetical protein
MSGARLFFGRSLGRLVVQEVKHMNTEVVDVKLADDGETDTAIIKARRTAFVARFIVLREGKRTKAHRVIEMMEWEDLTTVEELSARFRQAFLDNGDVMMPVDRDLRRSLAHSYRSLKFFISEYAQRATTDFVGALEDYGRSNELLFVDEEQPRSGGWRLPLELRKLKRNKELQAPVLPKGKKASRGQSVGPEV